MGASIISSRHNPLIRGLRATLRAPSRRSGVCVIEGWRLFEAAVAAGVRLDLLVMTEAAAADPAAATGREAARARAAREITVTPEVFAALTQVPAPQGVLGIAPRPPAAALVPAEDAQALVVVLDAIQDPGNVGTIVRTAVACGATAVVACGPTADPFGPKALRASAGAVFQVPIGFADGAEDAEAALRAGGLRIVAADAHAAVTATPATWTRPLALVLGSEAAGPAPVWRAGGALAVRVPVLGPVESLNVAAAAAVLLYQAAGLLSPRA
ncbi:MAG TPA: RNA methyltransferase [bacterium]|nr:RNA methyltransferase [bacterium]